VDPDLVGPARQKQAADCGEAGTVSGRLGEALVQGYRRPPFRPGGRHPLPVLRVAQDPQLDLSLLDRSSAVDDRQVLFLDSVEPVTRLHLAGVRFRIERAVRSPDRAKRAVRPTTAVTETEAAMNTITTKDGTQIYYKDWGSGQPVVFSHGWPLSADAWEDQMVFLGTRGYRCIAHDRRGHGRSGQPWNGNDMDTYADDLAALVETLALKNAIHVGHSMGGGEVARYIGRHGTKRVAKAVLIGAVPPLMLKTAANPAGLPIDAFDKIRAGVLADRSQFFKDLSAPFYGANRPNSKISQGLRDSFWLQGMLAGFKAVIDCIKAFSETDFTEDLKKFDVPTLIMHGDDDQIVPIGASAMLSSKIVKGATLKVYPGLSHGLCSTNKDQINADLLAFLQA
jgi:non-heme chloroperoxidase